ncbi:hypothetical protein AVEN_238571-1 [Araneus ventricosus]|uniref:Uncharacterized protein n=1 Tax=Araneus ventricosus TaxID=182803 RepID=A0A4Y2VTE1_ARAVE|nr:hypothetical protein AVEN_238571-1 [Araneus ventricosus]
MWPSVVLEEHYPIQELAPDLLLDGLFEPKQRVAIPLYGATCETALRTPLSSCDKSVKHAPLCAKKFYNCSLC